MISLKHFCYINLLCVQLIIIYHVLPWSEHNSAQNYGPQQSEFCKIGLNVNEDIANVLSVSKYYNTQLFLVEFSRLIKYISDDDVNRLQTQIFFDSSVFNTTHSNQNEISFGFFGHMVTDDQLKKVLENINTKSFKCYKSKINETILIGNTTLKSDNLRNLCIKGDTKINLIKFQKRYDYYWFIDSPNTTIYTGKFSESNNDYRDFVSAIDSFSLTECSINGVHWYLPQDLPYFIAQTKASRFVSCDTYCAKQFRKTNPNLSDLSSQLKSKIQTMITSLKTIMSEELKQSWILGGTLLGWYRQCTLFSYTDDVDFATWHHYASDEFTERLKNNNHGLQFKYIFGFIDEAYENAFMFEGFKLDLFYNYKFDDTHTRYAVSTHMTWQHKYSYYYHPKYEICSGELLGIRVNVPCNPRDIIIDTYGTNWSKPVKEWHWYYSPFNKGVDVYWDEQRKYNAFQEFDSISTNKKFTDILKNFFLQKKR